MDTTNLACGIDGPRLHAPRSRGYSGVSSTESIHLFEGAHASEEPLSDGILYSSTGKSRALPGLTSPVVARPTPVPASSVLHPSPSYHLLSPTFGHQPETGLQPGWFETLQTVTPQTGALQLQAESTGPNSHPTASLPHPPRSPSATMSVALQYDNSYDMSSRTFLSWPVIESGSGLIGGELGPYASDASLTPPSGSRSVTASPPRGTLTAGQRELKRQQDQARHSSKLAARNRRAGSESSYVHSPPQMSMSDVTSASHGVSLYAAAPNQQISLLAEPASTMSAPPYLTSFQPSLHDQSQHMYANPYSHQPYMPVDYSSNYAVAAAPSIPCGYGRPEMADPSIMYPSPTSAPMTIVTSPPIAASAPAPASVPRESSMGGGAAETQSVRVLHSRPKPQCWDHGCNGRQFSTFSNLLRHQREKSGQAAKATCPNCGAEFTRTTARNGHLLHDKCKQKKAATGASSS